MLLNIVKIVGFGGSHVEFNMSLETTIDLHYYTRTILSIIEEGTDIFCPTIETISLHTTSLTPSIAFISSREI